MCQSWVTKIKLVFGCNASGRLSISHPTESLRNAVRSPQAELAVSERSDVFDDDFPRHHDVARHEAAVNRQHDSRDRRGGVGGEERHGARDLDRLDDAAQRVPALELLQQLGRRSSRSLQIGVRTVPGQMMFARMLYGPSSIASDRVRLMSPAFAAL